MQVKYTLEGTIEATRRGTVCLFKFDIASNMADMDK